EIERPRSRSPTRTSPGSSGRHTPYPSAAFATPTAATTSYATQTCATPVIDYEELNHILMSLGINLKSIPYIVGGITPEEMRGLKFGPGFTKLPFALDLETKYVKHVKHQQYQPYGFS
ncbi:hypothetical protein A2U01_0021107, partial [Trifolium medium]|nr:hypothetical protein [Trifolium medium]